jgi:hypothetical protein
MWWLVTALSSGLSAVVAGGWWPRCCSPHPPGRHGPAALRAPHRRGPAAAAPRARRVAWSIPGYMADRWEPPWFDPACIREIPVADICDPVSVQQ